MTQYTMRQPWLIIGDDLVVKDSAGAIAYKVDGKLLSFRSSAVIRDAAGREAVRVREVLLSIDAVTQLERDGQLIASVKRVDPSGPKDRYVVETAAGDTLTVRDAGFRDYRIERGSTCLATIVKAPVGLRDLYDITIAEGEDEGLMLGIAVAIRQMARHTTD
jgi:uncharacterized protein YxjI